MMRGDEECGSKLANVSGTERREGRREEWRV